MGRSAAEREPRMVILRSTGMCRFGPRFPALTSAYDKQLRKLVHEAAAELGMTPYLQEGVYVHLTGPNYETPAEARFLRLLGADTVGMSTAPEVVVAKHCGMRVLGEWVVPSHGTVCILFNLCPCRAVSGDQQGGDGL